MSVFKNILSELPEALRSFRGAMLALPISNGFWRGKQFRAYPEFEEAGTTVLYYRFTATAPFLLTYQALDGWEGDIRVAIFTGSTPSGTWVDAQAVQAKYRITAFPPSTVSISTGGTFTGGTEREVLRAVAGTTQGNTSPVQSLQSDTSIRGLPAGEYYIRVDITGPSGGMYTLEWEDLDADGR
jgi:hypothetical protein